VKKESLESFSNSSANPSALEAKAEGLALKDDDVEIESDLRVALTRANDVFEQLVAKGPKFKLSLPRWRKKKPRQRLNRDMGSAASGSLIVRIFEAAITDNIKVNLMEPSQGNQEYQTRMRQKDVYIRLKDLMNDPEFKPEHRWPDELPEITPQKIDCNGVYVVKDELDAKRYIANLKAA